MIAAGASGGIPNPALSVGFLLIGVVGANLLEALLYLIAHLAAGAVAAVVRTFLGSGKTPDA